jgi:hypothetical protein
MEMIDGCWFGGQIRGESRGIFCICPNVGADPSRKSLSKARLAIYCIALLKRGDIWSNGLDYP